MQSVGGCGKSYFSLPYFIVKMLFFCFFEIFIVSTKLKTKILPRKIKITLIFQIF